MTKKFLTFGILIVVLAVIFIPTHAAHAASFFGLVPDLKDIVIVAIKAIAYILMTISALILTLSGLIFDKVIDFTIVKMAANLGGQGMGDAITVAWATLRDIANMCFIFVLLYAAFKTMFDASFSNFQTTVKNIIIVALLINFSLFFSKVVIDASNIVAVGFYNSIANQTTLDLTTGTTVTTQRGISAGYMNMLGLQTFYNADILDSEGLEPTQLMTIGVMSSVFMLITAIILLMAGVMFAARFIILVFLMILSPLALIAYVIPGQKGKFEEWKSALIAQSFFAPVYFALTWVVFKLGNSLITVMKNDPTNATSGGWSNLVAEPKSIMGLILNYVLIIGFSIAALVISKSMASKTAGFKAISGGIGTVAIGGAALAGRNTLGRASGLISESQREKWSKSNLGRAGLWMADKGKKGSFDVRGIDTLKKVPGLGGELGIMGKAGGKGGFAAVVDTKAKAKATYAKDVYGQTGKEKEVAAEQKSEATKAEEKANEAKNKEDRHLQTEANKRGQEKKDLENQLKEKKKKMEEAILPETKQSLNEEVVKMEEQLKEAEIAHKSATERKDKMLKGEHEYSEETKNLEKEAKLAKEQSYKTGNAAAERQKAYAERLDKGLPGTRWFGRLQPNQGYKEAARKVREQAKGKSNKDKAADLLKAMKEEEDKTKGESGETTTPTSAPTEPSTQPPAPTPPSP
ncbi:MAG: hypothetical protein A3D37_02660 [Candidatus Zambryskibacteria bacterium RIFCSPHIGHO2_02_FULL_38_22]|nr:MAG: hypothetical protein A3D37_02660 [Candidatus Zambryskibacteria bacterium RIFCSPHIGHO2_02_FULL_38_22]